MSNQTRGLFFLRHFNDIDHIVPVIDQWSRVHGLQAEVVIRHDSPDQVLYQTMDICNDFRLQAIAKIETVRIHRFSDFAPPGSTASDQDYLELCCDNLFMLLCPPDQPAVVVFDWTFGDFVRLVCSKAHALGLKTISLPHAAGSFEAQYKNHLIGIDDLGEGLAEDTARGPDDVDQIFDALVCPSEEETMVLSKSGFKIAKVIGSARYCDEWLERLIPMLPKFEPEAAQGKLKVVMFLRSKFYPVFWEEVARTMKLISNFPNVYLVVQHHTRENDFLGDLKNHYSHIELVAQERPESVKIVGYDVPAGSLVNWSDVVLDLSTSVFCDALLLNKPVLQMGYLHALSCRLSAEIPECHISNRNQLYRHMQGFCSQSDYQVYSDSERLAYIDKHLQPSGKAVLDDYVGFLLDCAEVQSTKSSFCASRSDMSL